LSGILLGFAVVFILIAVGLATAWIAPVNARLMRRGLGPSIYYITNPALMFSLMSTADVSTVMTVNAPMALMTALAAGGLTALVLRLVLRRDPAQTVVGAMASSYVNAGNIGVPIALYTVGNAIPAVSVLMVQLLLIAPLYLCLFSLITQRSRRQQCGSGPRGRGQAARQIVVSILNPVTIGTALGALFAVAGWSLPEVLAEPVNMLAHSSVPMLLLMFGLSLRGQAPFRDRSALWDTAVASAVKVVAMPLLAWVASTCIFRLEGEELLSVVVMATLPTAQNVYLFGEQFRMPTRVASDTSIASLILAVPAALAAGWLILG
jgi:malonate transporter